MCRVQVAKWLGASAGCTLLRKEYTGEIRPGWSAFHLPLRVDLKPSSGDLIPFTAKGLAGNHSNSRLSAVENHLQLR